MKTERSKLHNSILLVEDEEPSREALAKILRTEGFSVDEAGDGEEGLARACSAHPDVILLDIAMPRMDGMTMLEHLRKEGEWGRGVLVIILTNMNADDRILRGIIRHEPAYYLMKSDWHIDEVVHKIRECLESGAARRIR